jgi:hypothetical protein
MEEILTEIFGKLGGATAIARGTGFPVQTVHDWLGKVDKKAEIPPWRRPAVLDFARREGKFGELSGDARAYLLSNERTVGRQAA